MVIQKNLDFIKSLVLLISNIRNDIKKEIINKKYVRCVSKPSSEVIVNKINHFLDL